MASRPGEIISVDIKSPGTKSLRGYQHYLLAIDWYSRHLWLEPMREKSESTAKIKKIAEEVFARHGRYPVVLRSDNEPALNTRKLDDYLATKGGSRQNSEAYDARSNGLIERHIGTTFDGILTNLAGVG